MKNNPDKKIEGFMDFEGMLRQFFGDKSYGDQALRTNPTAMKMKLKKVLIKLERRVQELETTERHKERMLNEIERLRKDLSQSKVDPWTLVIHSFSLISRLLGYDYQKGYINTPIYYQTHNQHYSQIIFEGGDVMQSYYDSKNLITLRREVYLELKKGRHSDFRIAQIMNTTEYEINKLKKS